MSKTLYNLYVMNGEDATCIATTPNREHAKERMMELMERAKAIRLAGGWNQRTTTFCLETLVENN